MLAAIVDSEGLRSKSDYFGGESRSYATPGLEVSMTTIDLLNYQDIISAKAELEENAAKKNRNDDARSKYDGALKAIQEATGDLWNNYWECVETKRQMDAHLATYNEYLKLAGDEATAVKFLDKAIGADAIDDLCAWFDLSLPRYHTED